MRPTRNENPKSEHKNKVKHLKKKHSISVAITGAGGSGAVTTGLMLLDAMSRAGFYGYMSRSAGPQIRGGESAVMMRFASQPVFNTDDRFDVLLAMDWHKVERFADEIPLDSQSLIVCDENAGEIPAPLLQNGAVCRALPLSKTAKSIEGGRANMLGLGVLAILLGLTEQAMQQAVRATLGKKGDKVVADAIAGIERGMQFVVAGTQDLRLQPKSTAQKRWNISGNEACGLGALRGGVRFVAAYPITPASDILEWMAPNLEKLGGSLLQAEDELASINMIIGGSFGGVPSMTATSGPGLSLMVEGLGLAVTSETPVVVMNVMRGGPSTGIPTKSEQSDLNLALYGLHGDAPHLVLAPLNILDCVFTSEWSVSLSEQLQAVAIVLSDQSLGQSRLVTDPPDYAGFNTRRVVADASTQHYQRYQLTENAVSAMAIPGTPGTTYTADGLEHDERGTPSSMAADHQQQMAKRSRKLAAFDYGQHWAHVDGQGGIALITWGSSSAVCQEVAERLRDSGMQTRVVALRLLMPLNVQALQGLIKDCTSIVVVEQNMSGQLFHYLHAEQAIPARAVSYARPGPLPLRPGDIVEFIIAGVQADE